MQSIDELADRVCVALVVADAGRLGLERDEHLGIPDPYSEFDGYSSTSSLTIREVVAALLGELKIMDETAPAEQLRIAKRDAWAEGAKWAQVEIDGVAKPFLAPGDNPYGDAS